MKFEWYVRLRNEDGTERTKKIIGRTLSVESGALVVRADPEHAADSPYTYSAEMWTVAVYAPGQWVWARQSYPCTHESNPLDAAV